MKRTKPPEPSSGLKAGPLRVFSILKAKNMLRGLTEDQAELLFFLWDTFPEVRGFYRRPDKSRLKIIQLTVENQTKEKA